MRVTWQRPILVLVVTVQAKEASGWATYRSRAVSGLWKGVGLEAETVWDSRPPSTSKLAVAERQRDIVGIRNRMSGADAQSMPEGPDGPE
jgi:hypothetical protein